MNISNNSNIDSQAESIFSCEASVDKSPSSYGSVGWTSVLISTSTPEDWGRVSLECLSFVLTSLCSIFDSLLVFLLPRHAFLPPLFQFELLRWIVRGPATLLWPTVLRVPDDGHGPQSVPDIGPSPQRVRHRGRTCDPSSAGMGFSHLSQL